MPLKPCSTPGCIELVAFGRCDKHRAKHYKQQDQSRGIEHKIGHSDRRWRKARQLYLASHPLCNDPFGIHGEHFVLAEILDHIIPHRGNFDLCWDERNWQGLCRACNDRKTANDHGWSRESGKR